MNKNYLNDLSGWINAQQIKTSHSNPAKVAFLAVKDDVKTALDSEYSMLVVWKHMRVVGKLNCSYTTFRAYVRRYIHQAEDKDDKGQPPIVPLPQKHRRQKKHQR